MEVQLTSIAQHRAAHPTDRVTKRDDIKSCSDDRVTSHDEALLTRVLREPRTCPQPVFRLAAIGNLRPGRKVPAVGSPDLRSKIDSVRGA